MSLLNAPDVEQVLPDVLEVVREHAVPADEAAEFPVAALDALRRSGLLGLLVPAEHGGLGGTVRDMLHVSDRLSRECMSVGMIYAMHCQQVATLVEYAGEELRATLLPRIAKGEIYVASVTTEPGKGGHLLTSESPLAGDGEWLHLDRMAPIVTGGAHADGFLITMLAPGADSPGQVSLVYADRDQLDLTALGGWDPLGMRATHSLPMKIVGDVPANQVVGPHGEFRDISTRVFAPLAHLGWATCWLGTAAGALSRTLRLLRSPEERKKRDLQSELLRVRLSRIRQRLDTVHALIEHGLTQYLGQADGTAAVDLSAPPVQLLLNAVKLTASQECHAAVDDLVELIGMRHGYLRNSELALERALRDLRSAPLNYANERLELADGALTLMDSEVRLA
ncbi:acyl-CoA/acyl-ACP dehydrogenase [Actinomadura barringtoniae]|uniref:Acyl-CoA/acyl-ACP dehydrogenase n=1 Tax=Actinomadura barringtoniae TaxID=1427535 RepID=A0A939PDK5_9ACTN|nr:acyl-CoA dehydrogenase family protein [Actinomadura barringtoniae]MBO2450272.1 acyl-CoA/acyl-ACP dehydrogenase [Actinomadura barringtoniae]